ncbi:hypothetical protein TD95_003061, partial [Thielaviopsis punctulata]
MESSAGVLGSPPELTPLEQEVLDEYERLSDNMKKLASVLEDLAANPSTAILDNLRDLERKTSLVFTALKSSVYNIILQQEMQQQEMHEREMQQQQQQQQQQQHEMRHRDPDETDPRMDTEMDMAWDE